MTTIFALSSGALPAAIAVLRISGPRAFAAVRELAGKLPPPRRAVLRTLRNSEGAALDQALILCFPGPASATGEDLAELHLHGGRAVVAAVEAALAAVPGLVPAEAGGFTRRALVNGRIDLSAAEGLADLLAAETELQRRLALRSAEGSVRRAVEQWAREALEIEAIVEAQLDHGDEDDVADDPSLSDSLRARAAALAAEIIAVAARPAVDRLRDGVRLVLAGPPNAGKSTLFNVLADRDAAIVSPTAGTTRDRIEAPLRRRGIPYLLIDTAGLNEGTTDAIEAIGVARARSAIAEADILLWLGDDRPPDHHSVLWLQSRCDLTGGNGLPRESRLAVSGVTGEGIPALWEAIESRARALLPPPDLMALNARQRDLARDAAVALDAAAALVDPLLAAEELRRARRAFDAITGRAGVEDMLDALFARFCIGK